MQHGEDGYQDVVNSNRGCGSGQAEIAEITKSRLSSVCLGALQHLHHMFGASHDWLRLAPTVAQCQLCLPLAWVNSASLRSWPQAAQHEGLAPGNLPNDFGIPTQPKMLSLILPTKISYLVDHPPFLSKLIRPGSLPSETLGLR